MARAIVFSHHFYPSAEVGARRMSELVRSMGEAGWAITVIAAEEEDTVPELHGDMANIRVIRIPLPRKLYNLVATKIRPFCQAGDAESPEAGEKNSHETQVVGETLKARMKRYYHSMEWLVDDRKRWSLRALRRALALRGRYDWVLSSGPPMSVHIAARLFASMTGTRWMMDLRDPWVGSGHWNPRVQTPLRDRIERWLEAGCLRRADSITTASPGISAGIRSRLPGLETKIHVVYNGFDGEMAPPKNATGRLRMIYAGTLYYNRNPFPLLRAIHALLESPVVERVRVHLLLVGNCASWNGVDVAAFADSLGIGDCVSVLSPVSPSRVKTMIAESEVVINFAQGQATQIPAKLYEQLASGRELLLIAEKGSDSAKVARAAGFARVVEPGNDEGLRRALRELYEFYVEKSMVFVQKTDALSEFSRESQNRRFMHLLAREGAKP